MFEVFVSGMLGLIAVLAGLELVLLTRHMSNMETRADAFLDISKRYFELGMEKDKEAAKAVARAQEAIPAKVAEVVAEKMDSGSLKRPADLPPADADPWANGG